MRHTHPSEQQMDFEDYRRRQAVKKETGKKTTPARDNEVKIVSKPEAGQGQVLILPEHNDGLDDDPGEMYHRPKTRK